MKDEIKAGQYWVARYRGEGGDLLVGCVESVRNGRRKKNGEKSNQKVICVNLITGKTSTKDIEIFRTRNKHVKKNQADAVLSVWKEKGRPAAREEAVKMKSPYEKDRRQQELPLGHMDHRLDAVKEAAKKCGVMKANVRADIRAFLAALKRLQEKLEELDAGLSS